MDSYNQLKASLSYSFAASRDQMKNVEVREKPPIDPTIPGPGTYMIPEYPDSKTNGYKMINSPRKGLNEKNYLRVL